MQPAVVKKVGELACQMSSYLKELTATVISCSEAAPQKVKAATAAPSVTSYEVILSDTVLFPEGGGQPCDLGNINEVQVTNVQRRGDTCVHTTAGPLAVGSEVRVVVDWPRRVDHMQHHTAQHLLTAVMERELGLPTMSWALSTPTCYIQLPTAKVEAADVLKVQTLCNQIISARTTVNRIVYPSKANLPPSRSRGIPDDVTGPIRLIDIEGQDVCTCCGTHLENLAELQTIQLLHQEPKGNTCRLHFIAGDRVTNQFGELYDLTRSLIKELGTNQENVLAATQRRGQEASAGTKQVRKLLSELAPIIAERVIADVKSSTTVNKPFFFHREDADAEFLTVIAEAAKVAVSERVLVLGCGGGEGGQFMVIGPVDAVKEVSTVVSGALEGKGGQSKAGFRGKGNMKLWKQAVKAFAA
ncbi:tRNA synthetase, putative [Bodo saltans]|uniref:tRNA synthetase, putative n=1 Tax=Bodo saltans TaxID=75058 RepID=A0A0S4J566_BODSA|nr:tRNA synthetase, putative [Bodo saltans]|eukprot:CUG86550.1 tRNA synthetase, putative [Bodo saltans]